LNELPWKPVVYLPANLTVSLGEAVLANDAPQAWCEEKAASLLGVNAGRREVRKLAACLEEYVVHFRGQRPLITAALFFYPDFVHLPPRANTQIEAFGEHSEKGPLTMAAMRQMLGQPDELSFGEVEITEAEVPAGRALRAHRFRKAEPRKRHTRIGEEIVWVIWPPESTAIVSMATRWMETAFSKAAFSIADDMAKNFRIEPTHLQGGVCPPDRPHVLPSSRSTCPVDSCWATAGP
jgi:hypothetical protein